MYMTSTISSEEFANADEIASLEASNLLKAMSNESRLMILCRLLEGEKSVSDLEGMIGLSQSAISQHLAVLRDNALVNAKRDGQSIHYSLAGDKPKAIIETLHRIYSDCSDNSE